jgi:hypothetical protein
MNLFVFYLTISYTCKDPYILNNAGLALDGKILLSFHLTRKAIEVHLVRNT